MEIFSPNNARSIIIHKANKNAIFNNKLLIIGTPANPPYSDQLRCKLLQCFKICSTVYNETLFAVFYGHYRLWNYFPSRIGELFTWKLNAIKSKAWCFKNNPEYFHDWLRNNFQILFNVWRMFVVRCSNFNVSMVPVSLWKNVD